MTTYLLVNLIFMSVVLVILRLQNAYPRLGDRATLVTLGILLVLTAVFDSFIVGFGIVGYDVDKILGVYIGQAPVEDFFYAILAVILVPTIWKIVGGSRE